MRLFEFLLSKKPKPLDNVTPRIQRIFVLARNEADRHSHDYLGQIHLWGALLKYNEGSAIEILKSLKVDLAPLLDKYENEMKLSKVKEPKRTIPFTPKAKLVLKEGAREAKKLGFTYFGTEHLLLGFLKVSGLANSSLKLQGVDLAKAHTELSKRIIKIEEKA